MSHTDYQNSTEVLCYPEFNYAISSFEWFTDLIIDITKKCDLTVNYPATSSFNQRKILAETEAKQLLNRLIQHDNTA